MGHWKKAKTRHRKKSRVDLVVNEINKWKDLMYNTSDGKLKKIYRERLEILEKGD